MTQELIAWAAGLYDGEGSASMFVPRRRKTARRQMQVSQGGLPGQVPAVLVRFRAIVGEGNVTGPYGGDLYYWKTTRKDVIDEIARALWPYLSAEKRAQFNEMTARAGRTFLADAGAVRDSTTERAWAAGFFDAEGSVWINAARTVTGSRSLGMELPQSTETGAVPDALRRFHAIVRVGAIGGPRMQPNSWSRKPQYRWQTTGRHAVSAVVRVIWPWLGSVNRTRLTELRELLDPDVADLVIADMG